MILQELTKYYEALAEKGKISRSGWAKVKVPYGLLLDDDGNLLDVLPLFAVSHDKKGKEIQVSREYVLPAPIKKTCGIASNFLWENASYILGLPKEQNDKEKERAAKCFAFMGDFHKNLLDNCESGAAKAVCRFFEVWDPQNAAEHPKLTPILKELAGGANLAFFHRDRIVSEDDEIAAAWQKSYDAETGGETAVCLVTGEKSVPEAVHPAIKGVAGAQSSGAAVVSFNASAFSSFGKEQSLNAPVSKYAAFAYTTALNTLLADRDHVKRFGDMTVVYWAEDAETAEQDWMTALFDGESNILSPDDLNEFMKKLSRGESVDIEGISVKPDNRFHILALSPNAARLSVRFCYTDTFGHLAENLAAHYGRLEITGPKPMLSFWMLIGATVRNADGRPVGDPSPHLSGDVFRAILTGNRYPDTLYQQILMRVRAERNLTQTRAAVIKAYLLKNEENNPNYERYREVLQVKLNEETTYQPYVLGELFALCEQIQAKASNVTTIKDRFYTSACTTPAVVFPRIIDLAEKHLKKLDGGLRVVCAKELNALIGKLSESYPAHQSLQDQGIFQIGYYHRKEKFFEKKDKTAGNEEESSNE